MGTRILLVDDSVVAAQQIKGVLGELGGCEVVGHAKNGAEALKLYSEHKPDLVFMDLIMPVMDGLQALRTLKGMDSDAKVVVLSSVGGVESKVTEALNLGAASVITKPTDAASVRKVIDVAMGGEG